MRTMEDVERELLEMRNQRDEAESVLASTGDLLNSWARESDVEEAWKPEKTHQLAKRLWAEWSSRYYAMLTDRNEKAERIKQLGEQLNESVIDDQGTTWTRPTADAYRAVCAANNANKILFQESLSAAGRAVDLLEAAGFGQPGTSNTLLGMVRDALKRIEELECALTTLLRACEFHAAYAPELMIAYKKARAVSRVKEANKLRRSFLMTWKELYHDIQPKYAAIGKMHDASQARVKSLEESIKHIRDTTFNQSLQLLCDKAIAAKEPA